VELDTSDRKKGRTVYKCGIYSIFFEICKNEMILSNISSIFRVKGYIIQEASKKEEHSYDYK